MPLNISSDAIIEKNKLTSDSAELLLLKFEYQTEDPVYICLNSDEVIWNSQTWCPAIFSISGISETKDAEIPSVTFQFIDISRTILPIIEEFAGCTGAIVTIYVVLSKYLSDTTPLLEESMTVLSAVTDDQLTVIFTLGAENLLQLRMLKNRYLKNTCSSKFKVADVAFTSGDSPEPLVGNYLYGVTSGKIAKILKIDHTLGTWDGGDAAGTFTILHHTGPFQIEDISCYEDVGLSNQLNNNVATLSAVPLGQCNYTGSEINCDRSYVRCIELENRSRFRGFPGVGKGGILK